MAMLALAVTAAASALDLPVKNVNGKDYYYYEVKQKESIYSICRSIGVSRADVLRCNPAVIDGLRPRQVLLFPVSEFSDGKPTGAVTDSGPGSVREVCPEEHEAPSAPLPLPEPATESLPEVTEPEDTTVTVAPADNEIRLAVVLPFMLDAERLTKAAENYTEFYRGLLMAVDTVAAGNPDVHICVAAFDSEGSADRVRALAALPEVRNATYIIAPDDSLGIEILADMADSTGATVVNLFSVRNDAYTRHRSVYQGNIPQHTMYDRALDGFVSSFRGYTPVFLTATDIAADKGTFAEAMQQHLDSLNIDWEEIEFAGDLTDGALTEQLEASGRYVFVPSAGSREMLGKILPALTAARSRAAVPDDVRLFGYPEWIILRGEQGMMLRQLNTVIYSRFASDTESYPTRRVTSRYEELFGTKMLNTIPHYGLLGYDAGRWMLGSGSDYVGLQNSFTSGDVNSALYFVNFAPDGQIRVKCVD